MKQIELKVKSTMNGIFKRLRLRIKSKVSCELLNNNLTIHVKIKEEKLLLMKMININENDIYNEFFDKITKQIKFSTMSITKININLENEEGD